MEQTFKFTKKHTQAIKGIAISFLLCYHCFSQSSRLGGAQVNFWPLSQNMAMLISKGMVHCVGMFAFLSVYGLTLSMKAKYSEYDFDGHAATLFVLKRYVKLIMSFLVPFVFCVGVTFVTDTSRYPAGMFANIISIIIDFFGLGHLFDTRIMVNTWWFLSLEILLIVFLPFVLRFYKKYSWLIVPMFLLPGSFMLEKHVHLTKYRFVMPLAVCFADQHVFERLKGWKPLKSQMLNKLLKFILSTGLLLAILLVWYSNWGREHFEFFLNGAIPVLIIYWAYEFLLDIPVVHQILEFLGKYSATVFYVHTFIRSLWLKSFTYSLGYAVVIWLFMMGSSILIAVVLDGIKKLLHYDQFAKKVIDGFIGWADRTL